MKKVHISSNVLIETLSYLKDAGERNSECVVLWLAEDTEDCYLVKRVYRPMQYAEKDIFRIPPSSMQDIMMTLATDNLMIAAQVHSHPYEAFHSKADDMWAIIRHKDALSLVVPDFASSTDANSFFKNTKVFKLSTRNKWEELNENEVPNWITL